MTAYASILSCSAGISTRKLIESQKKTFTTKVNRNLNLSGFKAIEAYWETLISHWAYLVVKYT